MVAAGAWRYPAPGQRDGKALLLNGRVDLVAHHVAALDPVHHLSVALPQRAGAGAALDRRRREWTAAGAAFETSRGLRKKLDPGDALVLANILRTDMHAHRPLPADSAPAQAIAVLAHAQQDTTWSRVQGDVWNHGSLPTCGVKAVVGCSPSAFEGKCACK